MRKGEKGFEKEDIMLLAQLLHTMKELAEHIDKYYSKKDGEKLEAAKREFLNLQKRVDELI